LEFSAYDAAGCADNDHFARVMDCDSEFESRFATALCSAWDDVPQIGASGRVLLFEDAWLAPAYSRGDLFARAARSVIDAVFPDHVLLIMLAFPLEYEGEAPDGSPEARASMLRQRAMIRYYKRIFGVQPFSGRQGREGWLWRMDPAEQFVPRPKPSRARSTMSSRSASRRG
jgi:hypothetical protein